MTNEELSLALLALTDRVAALEATIAAKPAKAATATTSAPRKATAEQVVSLPEVCPFNAGSREGKLWALATADGRKDITRGELTALIAATPGLTRIAPAVYCYDFLVALGKKLAAKATPAPVVVAPVAAPAPIIELVVTPTEPVVRTEPAPVVDITPTDAPVAAPAAPQGKRTRKGATK